MFLADLRTEDLRTQLCGEAPPCEPCFRFLPVIHRQMPRSIRPMSLTSFQSSFSSPLIHRPTLLMPFQSLFPPCWLFCAMFLPFLKWRLCRQGFFELP